MSELDWKEFIQNNELLGSLNRAEIDRLLKPEASEERKFAVGEEIIRQDERGRSFYIIGSGSVTITRPAPEGGEINLAVLETGDFFGEMALLSQHPRSANVKAREECTVLRINAASLRALLDRHPEILTGIFMMLSERLHNLAERVVEVSYHEVNNKLELFSTKLDAELRAVNSTLAATQTVFDQTAKQANEVITSTERHWKRLMMIGSVVATMVVTALGWFGITNYREFKAGAEIARKNIEDNAEAIEKRKGEIAQQADKAKGLMKGIEAHIFALRSGATYSVVPMLQSLSKRNAKGAQYYLPILLSNLKLLLLSDDENSTTIIFKELYDWMTKTLVNGGKGDRIRNFQSQADFIFTGIVESEQTMPLRNKALSYYFLLANLAIEQNFSEYDIRLNELNKLLRDRKASWVILDADKTYFDPLGFALAIKDLGIPPHSLKAINQRIETAWKQIART